MKALRLCVVLRSANRRSCPCMNFDVPKPQMITSYKILMELDPSDWGYTIYGRTTDKLASWQLSTLVHQGLVAACLKAKQFVAKVCPILVTCPCLAGRPAVPVRVVRPSCFQWAENRKIRAVVVWEIDKPNETSIFARRKLVIYQHIFWGL